MGAPLAGRHALVTGGTRGIGRAIACRLAADGAAVTVTGTGRSDPPGECAFRAVDFGDREAVEAFAKEVREWPVDVLVNNAGVNKVAAFSEIRSDDFDWLHQVNLRAAFLLCHAALPYMRRMRWGRIVNVTSIFSVVGKELRASYAASKFGLDGMTAALAAEVAVDGILANCVAPGIIDTDLTRRVLDNGRLAELLTRVPIGRLGRAEEVAAFVAWLAGPENTFISGQNLAIDGGYTRV